MSPVALVRTSCLSAFIALMLLSCGKPQPYSVLPSGAIVLAFGDSITYGTGAGPEEGFPVRLASITGWRVINAGVPGELARDAGERLPQLLAQHQPELVLVELGGNDFLRQRPAQKVKEDIRGLLHTVQASGAIPVLIAVPRFSMLRATTGLLADSDLYDELAREEQVLLVPDLLSTILSDDSLRADPIHPNAYGYRALARGIALSLREVGLLQ